MSSFSILKFIPDKLYFHLKYFKHFRRIANFNNPSFFSEKIFIRMMKPLEIYSLLADRVKVRDYIKSVGCEEFLVPMIKTFDGVPTEEDLRSVKSGFVLKKNNSCGEVICIGENTVVNYKKIISTCEDWWTHDYSDVAREYHYSSIEPKIIMETFLGENIADYKMHIFQDSDGKYEYLFRVGQKNLEGVMVYETSDQSWNASAYKSYKKLNGQGPTSDKPLQLETMKEVGRKILGTLDYLRIDFYIVDDKLFIGEVTVTPTGGGQQFEPISYDRDFFLMSS